MSSSRGGLPKKGVLFVSVTKCGSYQYDSKHDDAGNIFNPYP